MAAVVVLVGVVGLGALALGGDEDGDVAVPVTTQSTAVTVQPPEPIQTSCPPLGESLEQANDATYAIAAEFQVSASETGYWTVGTAWAVDDHVLVTNAHITRALVEMADQGVQFERILAVQAGTGEVVTITRELTHPNYDGDPLRSPDVGLFTTLEPLAVTLPLADPTVDISLGDEVQLVGFPGDVNDQIRIEPGETVPQATSLTGRVTARRSHDDRDEVTIENLDVIQHQAPTTPGTSGSSLMSCGRVIGVNNAGTVNLIVTPGPDGELTVDRQAAASNNFAVHHRHIQTLLTLMANNAVQGTEMPAPAREG